MMRRALVGVACACIAAHGLGAQSLADGIAAVRNGQVLFHFAARAGVCGDGDRYIRLNHSTFGSFSAGHRDAPCEDGPLQVRLTVHDGEVDRVEAWVGPVRVREGRELGAVSAPAAASVLLHIAATSIGSAAESSILPAVLADSSVVWRSRTSRATHAAGHVEPGRMRRSGCRASPPPRRPVTPMTSSTTTTRQGPTT